MDERLEKLEQFEKRAGTDLIAIHQAIQCLSQDIKYLLQVQEHLCSCERISSLEQECDLRHQSLKTSLCDSSLQQSQILSKNSQMQSDLDMLKSRFADFEEMFLPAFRELQLNVSECLMERDQSHVLIPALLSSFEKKIMDHVSSIPKPQCLDIPSIKQELMTVCRDAIDQSKAAHNKTITNQSRLHILEKKVAQLSQEGNE